MNSTEYSTRSCMGKKGNDWLLPEQGVEKRHERRQDKAKFGEKAEFIVDK